MEALLGKTLAELQEVALQVGLKQFAGKQLAEWIYLRRVSSFDEMTNISLHGREALKKRYTIGRHSPVSEAQSIDGTRKFLFQIGEQFVETVYIPEEDRATLCVSTQMGCKMGCRFCMTGTLGFHGHLSAAEILNQILYFPLTSDNVQSPYSMDNERIQPLTNIVYMGEGEPLDNIDEVLRSLHAMTESWGCRWSPRRITVSSVGILPTLRRFLEESECHLAISLHNPFSVEREQIMPIEKRHHIRDVVTLLKEYDWSHQRRVSFEYICWHTVSTEDAPCTEDRHVPTSREGGIVVAGNDTLRHAQELLCLLRGLNCRVNLIRFHAGVDKVFPSSDERQMEWFRDYLTNNGLTTTIRRSRGEDILAACGMLVNALQSQAK